MSSRTRILENELITDPVVRGYDAMTPSEATTDINTEYEMHNRDYVEGHEILNATDDTEYSAKTTEQKSEWLGLCAVSQVDVGKGVAKSLARDIFGNQSQTWANLLEIKVEPCTRGEKIGIGIVSEGEMEYAMRKTGVGKAPEPTGVRGGRR